MRYRGRRLFTWSPVKSLVTPTPEAARGAFRMLAERRWGQWGCGDRGFRGHQSVFTGSKLSGFTHMVWNVRKCYITDRCTSASHGKSEVWLHTLYTERQGMKARWREAGWEMVSFRGVTKTRVPHIQRNLEVAYKMEIFSSFIQWYGKHV